ncbi:MAG: right-handed parallel beta-helix repeat-containing protein [Candidatus Brocadiia bacterium]
MRRCCAMLWVTVATLAPLPVVAATYYVDAGRGEDSNPGTSRESPFQTIGRAARAARPGDTAIVGPGTYDEQVGIGGFPDAARRTVFRAEPLGKAVLDGEEKQFCFSIRRPRVSIVGFACRHSREHAIDFQEPAHHGLVARCVLADNKLDGVFFRRCRGGRVESSVCARNGRHGVWFLDNDGGAAVHCTLAENKGAGLCADRSPGVVAFSNILAHNGAAIRISGATRDRLRSDHNLFEGGFIGQVHGPQWLFGARAGTLADWRELSGQDAQSLQGDPQLADPTSPASPACGARSPAFHPGLRVESLAGVQAPTADLTGQEMEADREPPVGALWSRPEPSGEPVATLRIAAACRVSFAIVGEAGQLVRTLLEGYPASEGGLPVYWDGNDALGHDMPPGRYRWHAIAHNVRGVDDGSVGDTGDPPYGKSQVSDGVCDLGVDERGDLYEISFWDEAGHGLRKLKADGTADWVIPFYIRNVAGGLGTAVATDGTYVFAALVHQRREKGGRIVRDDVRRLRAADGKPADFPAPEGQKPHNLIQVNPEKPEPWIHAQRHSKHQARRLFGIRGLAADAQRLFVSNYYRDRVDIYDKETGTKLGQFPVPRPLGVAVAPDGSLWVANSGDRVTQFSLDGTAKARIPDLEDPYAVTFGDPDDHLYLTEMTAGRIREYTIGEKGGPRRVRTLGRAAEGPGPVQPDVFRFRGYCGIAVDARGRISVTDKGNHRVQRFHPDGSLWQSHYSDFVAAPFVDLRRPEVLLSGTRQYRVEYPVGAWRFTHNWAPGNGKFATHMVVRRTLPNGRDYLFHLGGHRLGVVVYAVEGEGLRRSAMLGGRWMGTDDLGKGSAAGMYYWADADGDGTVEDPEIHWHKRPGTGYAYSALAPGWWVGPDGDLWLADQVTKSILRLDLLGFDERGNPRYEWARRRTVVPRDEKPWAFVPKNLRLGPDGDIYAQGTIEPNRQLGAFWMGGTAVARFAPNGARRWVRPLPRVAVALAADGDFWYVGEGPTAKVSMYTADGLLVCAMAPGKPSGYQSGWIDHAMGLFAFVHPRTRARYVYAEEDLFGKMIRYRIEGLETLRRMSGEFEWNPQP